MREAGIAAASFLEQAEALPFAGLADLLPPGGVLVLSPHPDDETLGCGGLLALAAQGGRRVRVVLVSDGAASHPGSAVWPPRRLAALRLREMRAALAVLGPGAGALLALGLPDGAIPDAGPAFEAALAAVLAGPAREIGASTVLTTWRHDPHGDHRATALLAAAVARATGARLWEFPVWGWRHRTPLAGWPPPPPLALPGPPAGLRLDIGPVLPLKRAAIAAHASQASGLIADAPGGFRLPEAMLAVLTRPFEVYLAGET